MMTEFALEQIAIREKEIAAELRQSHFPQLNCPFANGWCSTCGMIEKLEARQP
jgi:hypothetical protein